MSTSEVLTILFCGAGGSLIVYLLQRLERRNTEQHSENKDVLAAIRSDIADVKADTSDVKSTLLDHLTYHLEADRESEGRTSSH